MLKISDGSLTLIIDEEHNQAKQFSTISTALNKADELQRILTDGTRSSIKSAPDTLRHIASIAEYEYLQVTTSTITSCQTARDGFKTLAFTSGRSCRDSSRFSFDSCEFLPTAGR